MLSNVSSLNFVDSLLHQCILELCLFRDVVSNLLAAGASPQDENKSGYTPIHIAAKYGHSGIIEELANHKVNMRLSSRKIGLTALHISSLFGETEATRELLTHVPAQSKSELPLNPSFSIAKVVC